MEEVLLVSGGGAAGVYFNFIFFMFKVIKVFVVLKPTLIIGNAHSETRNLGVL